MDYDVYISEKAEKDLADIYDYYSTEFSEESAKKVLKSIKENILRLEVSAEGYASLDGKIGRQLLSEGTVRMIPDKKHLVFYLVRGQRVDVLRIRGARTDYLNNLENLFKNII